MSKDVALRILSEKQNDEMIYQTPIRISDAASIFRRNLNKNDRPYDREAITKNNDIVEEWYRSLLLHIADSQNAIPSGRVNQCLQIFLEGREISQHQKYKQHLPVYSEENVRFWIDTFKKSTVTDMMDMGPGVVSEGWAVIRSAIKYDFADRKWDKVYGSSTNPVKWDKLANDNPHLMNGRPMPFDLDMETMADMEEKVMAVIKNPIQPK